MKQVYWRGHVRSNHNAKVTEGLLTWIVGTRWSSQKRRQTCRICATSTTNVSRQHPTVNLPLMRMTADANADMDDDQIEEAEEVVEENAEDFAE